MNTSTPLSMRLPTALVEAIDRRAEHEQRSRANMVQVLIRSALADNPKETNDVH